LDAKVGGVFVADQAMNIRKDFPEIENPKPGSPRFLDAASEAQKGAVMKLYKVGDKVMGPKQFKAFVHSAVKEEV
jgi:hypothetical protein